MLLKTIIRNISRYKLFSILNLAGLSIGLTSVMLIAIWVYNENSYDKFNVSFERIYQINFKNNKGEFSMAGTPAPLAPMITENVAAIESAVRLRNSPSFAFKYGKNMYFEDNGLVSDPQLFDIFNFKTLEGDPKEALDRLNCIVITQSFAKRYFGSDDPLNKEILVEGQDYLIVSAVIEDTPSNSHIQFDYLLSYKFAEKYHFCGMQWGDPNFRTYILLKPESDPEKTALAITGVAKDNGMPHVKYGGNIALLRPLKNIYLDYKVYNRLGPTGDYRNIYIFTSIAVLILLLACINYINLTISLYVKRYKCTSVRKICGAKNITIFRDSLLENGALILLAFSLSLVILWFLDPFITTILDRKGIYQIFSSSFLIILLGIFVITLCICSFYPSLLFSKPKAIELLSGFSKRKTGILKSMVIFQNIIAIILIINTIGIALQMKYLREKKLGFKSEHIAYTYLRGDIYKKVAFLKTALLEDSHIKQVSLKDCLPYTQINTTVGLSWKINGEWQNQGKENPVGMETTRIDDQYFNMMDVEFLYGRNFSKNIAEDKKDYIINERAMQLMGLSDPIGTEFMLYGQKGRIIGVIKDTYFKSLHENINPQVFHLYQDEASESYLGALFFKINGSIKEPVARIQKIWSENNPGVPFEYHFLDADYEDLYKKDTRFAGMISIFCWLAVLIACMGLFGQSVITAENRIQEIGIRKVNGAKISEILAMLNKDFVKWVIIAFVIASPLASYTLNRWLQNFAYKTDLKWWIYILGCAVALVLAIITVSWQSWRAATRNPVEALRYE